MTLKDRVTPDHITSLGENQIFVFGSNESGRHGAGAARTALKWGAKYGQASGLQGRTYGIPTVDKSVRITLSVEEIRPYVQVFIETAKSRPDLVFLVTEIGCGLAGHKPEDIAPLFTEAAEVPNIWLPSRFWDSIV